MRRPKLDAATWAQLNQLLDSALDQPASARDRWVDQLGPEHAALKPRLRELLGRAADRDDPSFLETLPKFYADLADFPDVGDRRRSTRRRGRALPAGARVGQRRHGRRLAGRTKRRPRQSTRRIETSAPGVAARRTSPNGWRASGRSSRR